MAANIKNTKHLNAVIAMAKQADNRNIRVLQFLDAYEKQESLWNPSLDSYKNKLCRDEAYMRIIEDLNVPNLTISAIKLKVKSIRTTYTKELRMLTKHKEEGKPYTPKLFWFHRANSFLKNVSLSREKRTTNNQIKCSGVYEEEVDEFMQNINKEDDASHQGSSVHIMNEDNDVPLAIYEYKPLNATELPTHLSSSNLDMTEEPREVLQTSIAENSAKPDQQYNDTSTKVANTNTTDPLNIIPSISPNKQQQAAAATVTPIAGNHTMISAEDEYDCFCRSVAAQLRGITDTYSRSVAKLKIQQILFEAETGHYRNSSCISLPVNQSLNSL